MESLPEWFLRLYIIFLSLSLLTGLIGLFRQWFSNLSALTLILSLLAPLASLVYVAQRPDNVTIFAYLQAQFHDGSFWLIIIAIIFLYLIAWNLFLLTYFIVKVARSPIVREKASITMDKLVNQVKRLPFLKREKDVQSDRVERDGE